MIKSKLNNNPCFLPLKSFCFTDINECTSGIADKCGTNTDCTDTSGSYTCACQTGYQFIGDTNNCDGM